MNINHLTDFIDWLQVERGYSPHTVDGYSRDVAEFFSTLADDVATASISQLHIQSFLSHLYLSNSSSSVARKMSALRTFFRFLAREGHITGDPLSGVAGPKLASHIPVFLTVDEVLSFVL